MINLNEIIYNNWMGGFLIGIFVGTVIMGIVAQILNIIWYFYCERQNKEWADHCKRQRKEWTNHCTEQNERWSKFCREKCNK